MEKMRVALLLILSIIVSFVPNPIFANPVAVPSKDAGWLETLNYYRSSSGVGPVIENPTLSANAMKHSIYLAKSDPKFFTGIYENPHTENPQSPYYSIEGARSGTNLTSVKRESEAIDSWMQAPLHAIGLLRDNLKTTGYATAINDRTGEAHTGLDVLNGLVGSRSKVITFPGNGAIIRLNRFTGESPDPRESCGKDWREFSGLPIFASFLSSPPRDITGKIVTPIGKVLTPGSELCVVTQYSWTSTDKVISYGDKIMASEKMVLLIPKLPLSAGEHSVTLSGTAMSPLNWKFTVLEQLPRIAPVFDLDRRLVSWDRATIPAPSIFTGYTVIAQERLTDKSREYRTKDVSLSTADWTAGEYWICVKVRSLSDESECVWKYARVFEKLPTVKFTFDSSIEEITWESIDTGQQNRKFEYVVKSWSAATNKITDFQTTGRKFSTLNWNQGLYWICVQALAPGAESLCPSYSGYAIDRKPKTIVPLIPYLNPDKVMWDVKEALGANSKPDTVTVQLRSSKSNEVDRSEILDLNKGEWNIPDLKFGEYEICLQAMNSNGISSCYWKNFTIRQRERPSFLLSSNSIDVGKFASITNDSDVDATYENYSKTICDLRYTNLGLVAFGLKAGTCAIRITSTVSDLYLAHDETISITVIDKAPALISKKITIKCVKGRQIRSVTGVKPKCPAGYTRVS